MGILGYSFMDSLPQMPGRKHTHTCTHTVFVPFRLIFTLHYGVNEVKLSVSLSVSVMELSLTLPTSYFRLQYSRTPVSSSSSSCFLFFHSQSFPLSLLQPLSAIFLQWVSSPLCLSPSISLRLPNSWCHFFHFALMEAETQSDGWRGKNSQRWRGMERELRKKQGRMKRWWRGEKRLKDGWEWHLEEGMVKRGGGDDGGRGEGKNG